MIRKVCARYDKRPLFAKIFYLSTEYNAILNKYTIPKTAAHCMATKANTQNSFFASECVPTNRARFINMIMPLIRIKTDTLFRIFLFFLSGTDFTASEWNHGVAPYATVDQEASSDKALNEQPIATGLSSARRPHPAFANRPRQAIRSRGNNPIGTLSAGTYDHLHFLAHDTQLNTPFPCAVSSVFTSGRFVIRKPNGSSMALHGLAPSCNVDALLRDCRNVMIVHMDGYAIT